MPKISREKFLEEVERATQNGDAGRLNELNRMAAHGQVKGEGSSTADTTESAFRREVARAMDTGNSDRLNQLERLAAEDRMEDVATGTLGHEIARCESEGETTTANLLRSIQGADDPREALQKGLRSATGKRYDRLRAIAEKL